MKNLFHKINREIQKHDSDYELAAEKLREILDWPFPRTYFGEFIRKTRVGYLRLSADLIKLVVSELSGQGEYEEPMSEDRLLDAMTGMYPDGTIFIGVYEKLKPEYWPFSFYHEVGHIVRDPDMKQGSDISIFRLGHGVSFRVAQFYGRSSRETESWCDFFSAAILLDKKWMLSVIPTLDFWELLKECSHVSPELVAWRLATLSSCSLLAVVLRWGFREDERGQKSPSFRIHRVYRSERMTVQLLDLESYLRMAVQCHATNFEANGALHHIIAVTETGKRRFIKLLDDQYTICIYPYRDTVFLFAARSEDSSKLGVFRRNI